METQQSFDFERADFKHLMRHAVLDGAPWHEDGKRVSAVYLKAVLSVLFDHGFNRECWLSFATIAAEAKCSIRTAKRAVDVLKAMSLICVENKRSPVGVVCNHYRIVWSELSLLSEPGMAFRKRESTPSVERQTVAVGANDRSATRGERSATGAERSATGTPAKCNSCTQSISLKLEEEDIPPPPPTPSAQIDSVQVRKAAAAGKLIARIGAIRGIIDTEWDRGVAPEAVAVEFERLWAIANHPPNRVRFERGPAAACVWRYRNGAWPADGINEDIDGSRTPPAIAAKREAESRQRKADSEDFEAMRIVKAGRKQGVDEDRIEAALVAAGLGEASQRLGWRN